MSRRLVAAAAAVALALPFSAGGAERDAPPTPSMTAYVGTYTSGDSRGVYACQFNPATGELSEPQLAARCDNPSFLALHPQGQVLYAVSESGVGPNRPHGTVIAFARDPKSAPLQRLGAESTGGVGPCHLAVDRAGRRLLVANYGGGSVAALPLAADGSLAPATSVVQHTGRSVHPVRQTAAHAHAVNFSPDEKMAYVADLGLDRVLAYRWGDSQELLADPAAAGQLAPGAGPRHLAFHPSGRWAYVVNELDSTVTAFEHDAATGALRTIASVSTLPADFAGENTTAEIAVDAGGRFLVASNRGHDSLAVFRIDAGSGRLSLTGCHPTGGATPRHFTFDPTGQWVLAANQDSGTITVHRYDAEHGALTASDRTARVDAPVCIVFAPPAK